MKFFFSVILFLVFNKVCFSFSISALDTNEILFNTSIQEVVITGQLSIKPIEDAVQDITLISSEVIESGIYDNLASLLNQQISISISQDNILGSNMSYQGISGQNIKVLIDDIPIIGRLNGQIDLSQINLNTIERIEIIEGPLSVDFGTDALAATINIITKKDFDHAFNFKVNNYFETVGKYHNGFLLAHKGNNYSTYYNFSRKYFDGWSENEKINFVPMSQIADSNRFKSWKPKEQFYNRLQYQFYKNKNLIRFYIEDFREKITNKGYPRLPYFENAFDDYYSTYRNNIGSELKFKLLQSEIRLLLSFNQFKRIKSTYFKDLTTLEQTLVDNLEDQDTSKFDMLTLKLVLSKDSSNSTSYQLGVHGQFESTTGQRVINNYQEIYDFAVYNNTEWSPNLNLVIRPALRLIYNSKYQAPLIPSLNVLYKKKDFRIRSSFARGFRAPTLKELFLDFVDVNHNIVGNSSLLAETSINYRLSFDYSKKLKNNLFNLKFSIFHNKIDNKINLFYYSENENQYSYFNMGNYLTKGCSFDSKFKTKNTSLNFGVNYIGIPNEYQNFIYSSALNFSGVLNLNKRVKLNLFYKYSGSIPNYVLNENNNIVKNSSDSYNLLDISLRNDFCSKKVILKIGAKNIFNIISINSESLESMIHSGSSNSMLIGYGRSFFMSLNLNL